MGHTVGHPSGGLSIRVRRGPARLLGSPEEEDRRAADEAWIDAGYDGDRPGSSNPHDELGSARPASEGAFEGGEEEGVVRGMPTWVAMAMPQVCTLRQRQGQEVPHGLRVFHGRHG